MLLRFSLLLCQNSPQNSWKRQQNRPQKAREIGKGEESGSGKRGILEKGSSQKNPFSGHFREFRDSRDSREPPDYEKQRRCRPFSRDSRDFRDFRESSSEKTPFAVTHFPVPKEQGNPKRQGKGEQGPLGSLRFEIAAMYDNSVQRCWPFGDPTLMPPNPSCLSACYDLSSSPTICLWCASPCFFGQMFGREKNTLRCLSGSAKWERLKGRNGSLSKIFADLVLDLQGKWFGVAENCRKPQEAVSTPFSHLVSPVKRCSSPPRR